MTRALGILCLLWCGVLIGVSFIATPAKFQAESLTLPVALDVGRSTFAVSHLVQLALAGTVTAMAVMTRRWLVLVPVVAMLVQHLALLPILDARVDAVIAGDTPEGSSPHASYVVLELIKVLVLGWIGVVIFWLSQRRA